MPIIDHQQHIKAILLILLALAADCLDICPVGCPVICWLPASPQSARGKTLSEKVIIVCMTYPRQKPDKTESGREVHLRWLDKTLGRNAQLLV